MNKLLKLKYWIEENAGLISLADAYDKLNELILEEQNEHLKCQCKKATFTRTVDADFNPLCGKCGKPI